LAEHRYLIALGSNIRHHRHGRPEQVLSAALGEMEREGLTVERVSPVVRSVPLGPSRRRYANAVALVSAGLEPGALLGTLKAIEARFGRRRRGQRWTARVLDLDIVLWDKGVFADGDLVIPHPQFRQRGFVLRPAAAIAPDWRAPIIGLTIRQLHARLTRRRAAPR